MAFLGTGGNDTYTGTPGPDYATGGAGNDTLDGAAGDDQIQGGPGDDLLSGGSGSDALDYLDATNGVVINVATGIVTGWGTDTISGFESYYGSDYGDSMTGDAAANNFYGYGGNDTLDGAGGGDNLSGGHGNDVLLGGAGDDFLDGGLGNDTIDGGTHTGNDYVTFNGATTGIVFNLGAGTSTDGQGGTDTLINVNGMNGTAYADTLIGDGNANFLFAAGGNDFLDGGAGNDYLPGSTGDDTLQGGLGNDYLEGGAGNDSIVGGDGFDFWQDFSGPGGQVVNLALGTATDGSGGHDVLSQVEGAYGSSAGDSLIGDAGDNQLYGFDGNDTLRGAAGNDSLYGGNGNDTAQFSGAFGDYTFTWISSNELEVAGPDGVDRLHDIEHLFFDSGSVTIDIGAVGTSAPETLTGGTGGDLIRGGGGDDHVRGGGGDDALFGDAGSDDLQGDEGDDYLDGGADNDTMRGGTGNDTYVVDSNGDVVQEPDSAGSVPQGAAAQTSIGNGIDRVVTSIDYVLGTAIENLQLSTGSGATNGTGNTSANEIAGNEIANTLTGLAGNDTIDGGAGVDTSTYSGSNSQYTVSHTEAGWTVSGNGEGSDSLSNVERLQFGNAHLALDLEGNAGEVVKVLGAVLGPGFASNAQFVAIGLSFADSGMSYEELMGLALNYVLGSDIGNSKAVVDLLWANVVGTPIDTAHEQYFMSLIDGGGYTPATLGLLAADTSFNLDNIGFTGLQAHGVAYT